jgi:dihydrodiol dehydrogenase / D-xylose 1-dehydrogenase (NADP)
LDIASLMLNNGKHVLCEKPLAMNVRETKQLLALAKEKKLFLMEAMWSRFQPAHQKLREELKSGALGDVLYSHVEFGRVINSPRMTKMELGGGTVLDLGIYAVYFSQLVFGGER